MLCAACQRFATEHITIVAMGIIQDMHLCRDCSDKAPEIIKIRSEARMRLPVVHHVTAQMILAFLTRWRMFAETHGRELTADELINVLRLILNEHGCWK